MTTAVDIVATLSGRMHGSYGLARCPAHKDRSPSLSVREGTGGRILVKCFAGCEQQRVIDALRRLGAWPWRDDEPPATSKAEREGRRRQDAERERARLDAFRARTWQKIWSSAQPGPMRGSPIEAWLQHRVIDPSRLDLDRLPLRWSPHCRRRQDAMPAMVALMTDPVTAEPCGVHRTFLLPDGAGKAPVDPSG
jgi:hypothetical protein